MRPGGPGSAKDFDALPLGEGPTMPAQTRIHRRSAILVRMRRRVNWKPAIGRSNQYQPNSPTPDLLRRRTGQRTTRGDGIAVALVGTISQEISIPGLSPLFSPGIFYLSDFVGFQLSVVTSSSVGTYAVDLI